MLQLLQAFLDIALWRKGPQDLPASWLLTALSLIGYVALYCAQIPLVDIDPRTGFGIVAVDVAMLGVWLWGLLALVGRPERLKQTLTAWLGVGILFGALDVLVLLLMPQAMVMVAWWGPRILVGALIFGRVLMHALDSNLFTGMALSIAMYLSTYLMVDTLFGSAQ